MPEIVKDFPKLPKDFAEVKQGHWRSSAEARQPLGSLAASSCSIVVVHNPVEQRGYLGHFSSPHSPVEGDRDSFDSMISAIKQGEMSDEDLEAWVSGASLTGQKSSEVHRIHDEEVQADREYVQEKLSEFIDVAAIDANWLGDNEQLTVVTFSPGNENSVIEYMKGPLE